MSFKVKLNFELIRKLYFFWWKCEGADATTFSEYGHGVSPKSNPIILIKLKNQVFLVQIALLSIWKLFANKKSAPKTPFRNALILNVYRKRESNPHRSPRTPLKRVRLPIPPFRCSSDFLSALNTTLLVPKVGLEPTHCCQYRILNPARLPFRHFGKCA